VRLRREAGRVEEAGRAQPEESGAKRETQRAKGTGSIRNSSSELEYSYYSAFVTRFAIVAKIFRYFFKNFSIAFQSSAKRPVFRLAVVVFAGCGLTLCRAFPFQQRRR